jgi:hypothetical protein
MVFQKNCGFGLFVNVSSAATIVFSEPKTHPVHRQHKYPRNVSETSNEKL